MSSPFAIDLRLLSWTLNSKIPSEHARMTTALEYIRKVCLDQIFSEILRVIQFQGMTSLYLDIIREALCIRTCFRLTDIDSTPWASASGIILVDRRLAISSVSRLYNKMTNQCPNALLVDVCNTRLKIFSLSP